MTMGLSTYHKRSQRQDTVKEQSRLCCKNMLESWECSSTVEHLHNQCPGLDNENHKTKT